MWIPTLGSGMTFWPRNFQTRLNAFRRLPDNHMHYELPDLHFMREENKLNIVLLNMFCTYYFNWKKGTYFEECILCPINCFLFIRQRPPILLNHIIFHRQKGFLPTFISIGFVFQWYFSCFSITALADQPNVTGIWKILSLVYCFNLGHKSHKVP